MEQKIKKIAKLAQEHIEACRTKDELEQVRIDVLGRKGELTGILRSLGELTAQQRAKIGASANKYKAQIEKAIEDKVNALAENKFGNLATDEWVDMSLPTAASELGHLHPVSEIWMMIEDIFAQIGFAVATGPEIEWDDYNFGLLNMPKDHPARDTQDTFYLNEDLLLRTQTSPVQIRYMKTHEPPVRIIAPGRVYRRDYDMTHTPMFHQFEGLVVDKGITIADLKGTCVYALQSLLGKETRLRFRPHHFPFTEPSLEVDVSCAICGGKGCRTCKQIGWLEMAGAGMVHPQVLRNVGYDPEEVSGFAFGFGIDRITMMRYGISDLRMMFENDMRFLSQF